VVVVAAEAQRRPPAVVRVPVPQPLRVRRHQPVPGLVVAQLPRLLARRPVAPGMPAVELRAEAGRPAAAAGAAGGQRLRRNVPQR
jgi:hypothetical protein